MEKKALNKKVELLAPAGDLDRLKTAVLYGADAVYIGGEAYSLRSRAGNFTIPEIKEAVEFAKERGARVHVTVNAIHHDEDLDGLKEYLIALEDCGVTAIIVATLSVMKLAKEVAPKLEVHASTQLSITNHESALFLHENYGIDRAVLARECTLDDVRSITNFLPIETEAFIHGGMCVNYSGRCTLSNRMTNRDANRGGCAQSCRWQYKLFEEDKEISNGYDFTMGSKDLRALRHIEELIHMGVSSFKIEGRMKTEYYIASIVNAYRELIDDILEKGHLTDNDLLRHQKNLSYAENREVWDGFYGNKDGYKSIIYHATSNADVNHDFLAKVVEYDDWNRFALIETRNKFNVGEEVEVLSPGAKVKSFVVEYASHEQGGPIEVINQPMKKVIISVPFSVKEGDILRRKR